MVAIVPIPNWTQIVPLAINESGGIPVRLTKWTPSQLNYRPLFEKNKGRFKKSLLNAGKKKKNKLFMPQPLFFPSQRPHLLFLTSTKKPLEISSRGFMLPIIYFSFNNPLQDSHSFGDIHHRFGQSDPGEWGGKYGSPECSDWLPHYGL